MSQPLTEALRAEAGRIEEDALFSHKGHYFAAERWGHWRYGLGIPATLSAAIASGLTFSHYTAWGGVLALVATALTALMTFLNPAERAAQHTAAGGAYLELRNQARLFREIELLDAAKGQPLRNRLLELDETRNKLNRTSPKISQGAYEQAKKAIEKGQAIYQIDKEAR